MPLTKISDLNSLYNNIYQDALFVAREANLMTNLVTPYSATGWMTRTIATYPTGAAAAKAEGVDFTTAAAFDKTALGTLTPAMIFCQFILTDERVDTDPQDSRADAATELGNAIATKIDKDLCGDFASFTTDKGPGTSAPATIAKFAAAISYLRNQITPNPIYAVVHPYAWHDIFIQLGQPASYYALLGDTANTALRDFFVGRWINIEWYVSANIPLTSTGTDAVSGVSTPRRWRSIAARSRRWRWSVTPAGWLRS